MRLPDSCFISPALEDVVAKAQHHAAIVDWPENALPVMSRAELEIKTWPQSRLGDVVLCPGLTDVRLGARERRVVGQRRVQRLPSGLRQLALRCYRLGESIRRHAHQTGVGNLGIFQAALLGPQIVPGQSQTTFCLIKIGAASDAAVAA